MAKYRLARQIVVLVDKTPGWKFVRQDGTHIIVRGPLNRNICFPIDLERRKNRSLDNYLARFRREGLPI